MERTPERKSPLCGRGKTMKDYEEEIIELRRDNFDLRMRIYLMEEQEESIRGDVSSILPPSFAQLKDVYINNTQLKTEVEKLKKDLAEKEKLVTKASDALENLERDHMESIEQIKSDAAAEERKLVEKMFQLEKELSELKSQVRTCANYKDQRSYLMNDSTMMCALAFGLNVPDKLNSEKDSAEEKISLLEVQIGYLEKELREESTRKVECDLEVDKARLELKRSEDCRRVLADELKHREMELAKAHKLIEDKCSILASFEEKLKLIENTSNYTTYSKLDGRNKLEARSEVELLAEKLRSKEMEVEMVKCENMKAMRTIQGFVKQNKALTRDLEEMKGKLDRASTGSNPELLKEGDKEVMKENILKEEEKDKRICELENEVRLLNEELNSLKKCFAVSGEEKKSNETVNLVITLRADLETKKKEVELLNEELRKRTFNLQELVNKELWDKNREIEKLNKAYERKQIEISNLKQDMVSKNEALSVMQEKLENNSIGGTIKKDFIDPLSNIHFKENKSPNIPLNNIDEKLKEEVLNVSKENRKLNNEAENMKEKLMEQVKLCESLKGDIKHWKSVAEESEKSRKELVNACTLLTTRLEEISTFLESLLPCLGNKKRRMLQQAIDRSREMSRSFSFIDQSNLSIPILPDVSQVDFCSGDESLAQLEVKSVSENDEVVRLRTQVESLVENLKKKEKSPEKAKSKKALFLPFDEEEQLEDISEGSLLDSLESDSDQGPGRKRASIAIITRPADNGVLLHSESDGGWSEPDRNVSKERLGINDSLTRQTTANSSEESSATFNKSPPGKKVKAEGLAELRRLSAKVESLEHMNESLHAELLLLQEANSAKVQLNTPPLNLSPRSLLHKLKSQINCSNSPLKLTNKSQMTENDFLIQLEEIAAQAEKSNHLCLELEDKVAQLSLEKKLVEDNLEASEMKVVSLSSQLEIIQSTLKEKDNHLLEKQCSLLEANNQIILLKAKLDSVSEKLKDKQVQIEKLEKEISQVKQKNTSLEEESEEFKKKLAESEIELNNKVKCAEVELEEEVKRRIDVERRLVESYENQTDIRARLDQEILRSRDMETHFKLEERSWRRRLSESEGARLERECDLRRKLDAAVVTTSEAVLERTRLANEKLRLQHHLRANQTTHLTVMKELERRVAELEVINSELETARCRCEPLEASPPVSPHSPKATPHSPDGPRSPMACRQQSNPSSDYVSDPEHYLPQGCNTNYWMISGVRTNNNSSPDLGIESDHHSLALCGKIPSYDPLPSSLAHGDVNKLEAENEELRRQLLKTRKALEETLNQLTSANEKKKLVEKAICKQLHKTHHILQKAKINLEIEGPLSQ